MTRPLARLLVVISLSYSVVTVQAQTANKTPVLTLGSFHFNFPNLDTRKVEKSDQIDVLDSTYQREVEGIVHDLARFRPTIIVIERQPSEQSKVDSLFAEYLVGKYPLTRREDEQIGFRLAKASGANKLYCVDEWGNFNEKIGRIVEGSDSIESARFETYYYHNPDSLKKSKVNPTIRSNGIRKELLLLNDEKRIKKSLGDYLVGIFKYESKERDFLGVDFETGRWFSRNLKIFRNIQRIKVSRNDRIVVIFGAGHLNLLNYFLDCSPEFERVGANEYLK